MRALLIPATGDVRVLESPTWSENDIAVALGVADAPHPRYHASMGLPGWHNRPYATIRRELYVSRHMSLVLQPPVLVFATDTLGMLKGLTRRELLHLGLLYEVEKALLELASERRKELE